MARFERSKGRRDSGRGGRDSSRSRRDRRSFDDHERDSGRRSFSGRRRRDSGRSEMTEVTCSECGSKCKVPFKPTSDKPVYCSECFEKREKGSKAASASDVEAIHEKLDKILALLKKD